MAKFIKTEKDILITPDWLIDNGFNIPDLNVYQKDYLVLSARMLKHGKDIVYFAVKVNLNGTDFFYNKFIRYVRQIPVLPPLKQLQ